MVPKYLKFELPVKLDNEAQLPNRANPTDAGADLVSIEDTEVPFGRTVLVRTGVCIKIPMGYVGLLFSKSGQALKGVSLGNSVGVIDSDYRGEIKVPLVNINQDCIPYVVSKGQKIAQLVVMPIMLPTFSKWEGGDDNWIDTTRGTGGFGSTGL